MLTSGRRGSCTRGRREPGGKESGMTSVSCGRLFEIAFAELQSAGNKSRGGQRSGLERTAKGILATATDRARGCFNGCRTILTAEIRCCVSREFLAGRTKPGALWPEVSIVESCHASLLPQASITCGYLSLCASTPHTSAGCICSGRQSWTWNKVRRRMSFNSHGHHCLPDHRLTDSHNIPTD